MRFPKSFAVAGLAIFALAACGGSTAAPTGATTPTAPPTGGPTTTPAPTAPPTDAPAATPAPTVGAVDLCSLLTADDLHTVLGGGWLEGAPANDYCHWDSASSPGDQLITAFQAGDIAGIKSRAPGGVDMDVSGHEGYSLSQPDFRLLSVWVDIGGRLLTVEFPTSSDASADQVSAQELAEIAIGNM